MSHTISLGWTLCASAMGAHSEAEKYSNCWKSTQKSTQTVGKVLKLLLIGFKYLHFLLQTPHMSNVWRTVGNTLLYTAFGHRNFSTLNLVATSVYGSSYYSLENNNNKQNWTMSSVAVIRLQGDHCLRTSSSSVLVSNKNLIILLEQLDVSKCFCVWKWSYSYIRKY